MYPVIGHEIVDSHPSKRVWLAGDMNIIGIEDCFVSAIGVAESVAKFVENRSV
jgi:hypothetical protein